MRDKDRIPDILMRLNDVWDQCPDLRLGQLILNVYQNDFYGMEDEEFISHIEDFYYEVSK